MQPQLASAGNPFEQSRALFDAVCDELQGADAFTLDHAELERRLSFIGRMLLRRLTQDHLDLRGVHERAEPLAVVVGEDGGERNHRREAGRKLELVYGEVEVPRIGYSQRGQTSRYPMDAVLNLPMDRYSLGVRHVVALTVAQSSYEETVRHLGQTMGLDVPKRQAELLAQAAARDFTAFYNQRTAAPATETAALLILTTDGKGVVMRKDGLREATRRAAQKKQRTFTTRPSKGEKLYQKRMAQVTAIYTVAPFVRTAQDVMAELTRTGGPDRPRRPKPEHKQVRASVKNEPVDEIRSLFAEAGRRDPERRKTWAVLIDGQETQLALVQAEAKRRGATVIIVVDFIHVLQYIWKASTAFFDEKAPDREAWVLAHLREVLCGKAVDVAAGMRRSATLRDLDDKTRAPVDKCADYLLKYKAFLRYDEYLRAGLPIATGVIEGACRHLVMDRMDLSGAHWGLHGAEAVLRLRALQSNADFEAYWAFHEKQEFRRNHAARYAGPPPLPNAPRPRPKLHLIPGGRPSVS